MLTVTTATSATPTSPTDTPFNTIDCGPHCNVQHGQDTKASSPPFPQIPRSVYDAGSNFVNPHAEAAYAAQVVKAQADAKAKAAADAKNIEERNLERRKGYSPVFTSATPHKDSAPTPAAPNTRFGCRI